MSIFIRLKVFSCHKPPMIFWLRNIFSVNSLKSLPARLSCQENRRMLYSALTVLPDHMYPAIAVNNKNDLLKILAEPSKVKCSGCHIHTFLVPNIRYSL